MMVDLRLRLFAATCVLYQVHSYPNFRERIPNGFNVTNPCDPDGNWLGVGHEAIGGGGKRNSFGLDFAGQGYTWTDTLCRKDSDGDGRANGEELGDPSCAWEQGSVPQRGSDISHPGICEPVGSEQCKGKNTFLETCSDMVFKCDGIDNDADSFSVDVLLSSSPVPAKETTYMCQAIDLKDVGVNMEIDYHLVATKGYVDTLELLHHVVIYGCSDDANIEEKQRSPTECFMNRIDGCENLIGIWSVGLTGFCYQEDAGFRVGKNGFKTVVLELHWNNVEEKSTFVDSSGITLFLTPNLRSNDAGMLTIGQLELNIPPYTARHTEKGTCSSKCTERFMSGNINIVGAMNHMHGIGTAVTSNMVSGDGKVTIISHEESYDYNSPKFVVFERPLVMEPGYSLEVKCHYDSSLRGETTRYGDSTSEEMCFTVIMYYPANNWEQGKDCISHGEIEACEDDCDYESLGNQSHPDTMRRNAALYTHCEPGHCKEGCIDVVREIFQEPCFQGVHLRNLKNSMNTEDPETKLAIMDYFYRLDSCNAELAWEECRTWSDDDPLVMGGASRNSFALFALICIFTNLKSVM
ncbi:MOXD1 homolog 2-like isoform X2 [Ruditapes philippinarum]|uniref:MOXD1 homolog 2-like isoform X2 n=1 Tax=Ruditapes philippinarum TaxID=129788 RepID=UPI00295BCA00|nr:MOXD1 homolog 2-like isoform X2 [Ruditapes philippinarum]